MIGLIPFDPNPEFTWLFRRVVPDAPRAVVRKVEIGPADQPNIVMHARVRGETITKILSKEWIREELDTFIGEQE